MFEIMTLSTRVRLVVDAPGREEARAAALEYETEEDVAAHAQYAAARRSAA